MDCSRPASGRSDRLVLEAAGARLAITRAGRGSISLVCLHAIGHGARDFMRIADEFGPGAEVIAIDFPGHGASPPELAAPGERRYAELLGATLDALELASVFILGNSVGGAAAIRYAAAHPKRVRGLILCDPAGLQPVNLVTRFICRRMSAFFARGARGDPRFPAQFRRYYEREVLPSRQASWRREEIIASALDVAPILQQAWRGFAEGDADLRQLGPQIKCPVLFAWSKRDRYVAWSRSKRAALAFPYAQVRFFEGGHSAFLEEPAAFALALKQFLATPEPGIDAARRAAEKTGAA
ncbi:MAG TPA: alpha/beta hydrolase [Bradyrhizobium sp.]